MTRLKNFLLSLLFPAAHCRLEVLELHQAALIHQADWLDRELATSIRDTRGLRQHLGEVADARDLCLGHLMTLVARDDDGHWTTVFDADTRLPAEIAGYLGELVARA